MSWMDLELEDRLNRVRDEELLLDWLRGHVVGDETDLPAMVESMMECESIAFLHVLLRLIRESREELEDLE